MSSYEEQQKSNAFKFKKEFFDDAQVRYMPPGTNHRHFLYDTKLNLWEGTRENVLKYFKKKGIPWHRGKHDRNTKREPEGNMVSSQVACLNHLFPLRENREFASAVLHNIDNRIVSAEIVCDGYGNDGYTEFEAMGTKENNNLLGEKSPHRARGVKSTSIDAVMVGKKDDGKYILVSFEWKYTEAYTKKDRYKEDYHTYHLEFENPNCPIKPYKNFRDLYYDPIYQLMRQTLLCWKMVEANVCGCDEYIHLHIIPKGNLKIQKITSPNLKSEGKNMSDVWKNLLKDPSRYKVLSPEELLAPLNPDGSLKGFFDYLKERYLEEYAIVDI